MNTRNKYFYPVTKITKGIFLAAICFLLLASNANADFNVYLQNKLGDDKELIHLFSEITTDSGDIFGNPGRLDAPVLPGKLLKLAKKLSTNSLSILNLMVIEYQCGSNPGSSDCWSYDSDFLSFPNGPLYCDFKENIIIDTSDKIVSGSGDTGQTTYETTQVRIVLNEDFTVSYRVLRRNPVTGIYSITKENLTVANNGMACILTRASQ